MNVDIQGIVIKLKDGKTCSRCKNLAEYVIVKPIPIELIFLCDKHFSEWSEEK